MVYYRWRQAVRADTVKDLLKVRVNDRTCGGCRGLLGHVQSGTSLAWHACERVRANDTASEGVRAV